MALFLGQKWDRVRGARLVLVGALLVLLVALFRIRGHRRLVTLIIPGVILLFAISFVRSHAEGG